MDSSEILDTLRRQLEHQRQDPAQNARQLYWIEQFFNFHGRIPATHLEQHHLLSFLSYLTSLPYLSPHTQLQAIGALLFLFRSGLKRSTQGLKLQCLAPHTNLAPCYRAAI